MPSTPTCLFITSSWSVNSLKLIDIKQELESEYHDRLSFLCWDYDQLGPQLRMLYDIKAVPLIRLIKDQQITFQQYGGIFSKAEIKGLIYSYLEL
ncbi:hypothetical protein EBR43_06740 [bacterium]|jgi:hypothetical protein|nr:hypothetical protein [bacterium]NBW57465.1 hypothetical protein [bacterium]NBX72447.1 hypothetical protein [bacterium]